MRYYPLFIDTKKQNIAIVGGNVAALNKYRLIKRTEAQISVFADDIEDEFENRLKIDGIDVKAISQFFWDEDYLAAFIADERGEIIIRALKHCRINKIAVNVIDKPEDCTFFTPAIVDRSPLVVAIGSEGTAPVLTRHIKSNLERQLPEETGAFLEFMRTKRHWLASELKSSKARREFWKELMPLEDPLAIARKGRRHWHDRIRQLISLVKHNKAVNTQYEIFVKKVHEFNLEERNQLQAADVVIYERGIDRYIVDLARRDAMFIEIERGEAAESIKRLRESSLSIVVLTAVQEERVNRTQIKNELRLSA